MNTTPRKRPHIPALDGLRGVANIMVVFYHNFPILYPYLFFSWLAMDIFFVMSGYLITDILIKTIGTRHFMRNFYARRLLRVFPLYFLSLVILLLILPLLLRFSFPIDYFISNQVYFWTFLQNWLLIFHPHPNESYLNHLWSMAVEEQFYLLWPLVFVLVRNAKILFTILLLLLIGIITIRFVLWTQHIPGLDYFSLFSFTRIDGICIGCMVALLQLLNANFIGRNLAFIVVCFAAANFIFYLFNRHHADSFPYVLIGYSTFSMLFGLIVYDLVNRRTRILEIIFSFSLLRFVGMISYGAYVFHWPVFLLMSPWLRQWSSNHLPISAELFASIVATLVSYGLGFLSYELIEKRFLRLKKYFPS
ncbi:MAG: acyltransferase family protein [Flavisolibacter sp.]